MHIAILGRQPELGIAELERVYGADSVRWFSKTSATVSTDNFDFEVLGGSQKAGRVITTLPGGNWRTVSTRIVQDYYRKWQKIDHKITLGISVYGLEASVRDIQATGIILKKKLRHNEVSLRLIPNAGPAHNTAVSHHNKLGLSPNKVELLIVRAESGKVIIAESVGAQNITAIAARDQARPKTDAFVGMLPPKLARMMINLTVGNPTQSQSILDPFCGTGVVLQEALLLGYKAYGSDLSEKMVDYSQANLEWLTSRQAKSLPEYDVKQADATKEQWHYIDKVTAITSETYLGQPFSAPPTTDKLTEVRSNCNHIISTFLKNLAPQITPGTPLCLAVPAWRGHDGHITHLPLIDKLSDLGYKLQSIVNVRHDQLIYYRENQVVARQLLLLEKS